MQGDIARYKLAAASYLLLPGTPFIYCGEEVGLNGGVGLSGDAALRVSMSWSADKSSFTGGIPFRNLADNVATLNIATQTGQSTSLLSWYK